LKNKWPEKNGFAVQDQKKKPWHDSNRCLTIPMGSLYGLT
jgi:hypothetical protein